MQIAELIQNHQWKPANSQIRATHRLLPCD